MTQKIADCRLRIADWRTNDRAIQNPQSKHSNPNTSTGVSRRAARLLEEAQRYLVGGVNSPVRAFRAVGGDPVLLVQGAGAQATDTAGTTYVDLIMGWGALVLGHANPRVTRAVQRQVRLGSLLGLTAESEIRLAAAVTGAFPSIEQVRFLVSGTEACMTAIRLARAATARTKVLTFEGCYHGHSDGVLVRRGSGLATLGLARSEGVPEPIAQETIVAPYNDPEALDEVMARYGEEIACAICEPVAANMGVVVPERAFLSRLREATRQRNILLIFDEVVTGFRVAYGGAQTRFGVTPDLTVLGKIIGGGFPIGALGGPRRLMERLAPTGGVYHAGTFAGHPVAMAAGLATLQELRRRGVYERLEAWGARLAAGLRQAAARAGIPVQVNQFGSMLTVFFSSTPVRRLADAQQADADRFARVANALRADGILMPPSPFEAMFLSTAHSPAMVDRIIEAFAAACAAEAG